MKHRFFPKKWSDINSSSNKLARMNPAKWISKLDSFLEFLLYRLWSHDIPELWSNSITSHKESLFTNFGHCCRQHFFASFIVSLIRVVGRKKLKIFLLAEFFLVSLKWKIFISPEFRFKSKLSCWWIFNILRSWAFYDRAAYIGDRFVADVGSNFGSSWRCGRRRYRGLGELRGHLGWLLLKKNKR